MSQLVEDRPTLTARALEDLTASALVVGVGTGPDGPVLLTDALPAEAATALEASFELLGVRGAADEVHRLPGLGGAPSDADGDLGGGEPGGSRSLGF